MALTRGGRIIRICLGPWEPAKGTDIPGIAGATWYYARCYLEFESHEVYELDQWSVQLSALPMDATSDPEIEPHLPMTVEDVVVDASGDVRVMLSGGWYLENASLPGGSRMIHGHLSEWSDEELNETHQSLIDGRTIPIASFVRPL